MTIAFLQFKHVILCLFNKFVEIAKRMGSWIHQKTSYSTTVRRGVPMKWNVHQLLPQKITELFTTTIIFTSRIISCSKHRQNSLRTEKTVIIFDSFWLLQTSPSGRTFFAQAIFFEKSPIVKHYHRLINSITWLGVISCFFFAILFFINCFSDNTKPLYLSIEL